MKNANTSRLGGFTLVELLVVVLIVGILAAVALAQYQVAVAKARYAELISMVTAVKNAEEVHYMANGSYTKDLTALDIDIPYEHRPDSGGIYKKGDFYVATDSASTWVYGKYVPLELLYLVFYDNTSTPGKRQCRTHSATAVQAEKVCLSLGGKYVSPGPFDGKIYDLP